MRIWDIVDKVYPGVEFVETQQNRSRLAGIVSSAAQGVFAVSLVMASNGTFAFTQQGLVSDYRAKIQVATAPQGVPLNYKRPRAASIPVLDEFYAVRHDVSAAKPRRVAAEDDDPMMPVRSDGTPGERFRGKHGNLVFMKKA